MSFELLFREALGPQPGGNFLLLFGALGDPVDPPDPDPDVGLPRGLLRSSCTTRWQRAERMAPTVLAAPWRAAQQLGGTWAAPWATAAPVAANLAAPWGSTIAVRPAGVRLPWGQAAAVRPAGVRLPWRGAAALAREWASKWRAAEAGAAVTRATWGQGAQTTNAQRAPWGQGLRTVAPVTATWTRGTRMPGAVRAPWQAGMSLQSIGGPWAPRPRAPVAAIPCYQPDPGNDFTLLFREALTGLAALVFACRVAALALVPVRRVYMVTNVTTLTRLDTGAAVPCLGFSLSLDPDSWSWGFSAELHPTALPLLEPGAAGDPVVLQADVNGTAFRVIARSISRQRNGVQEPTLRVDGVGHTAVLAEPFSPISTFSAASALTSQQLADAAMPAGWSVDWGITPWLVPGGLWSHQGTPASAVLAIAAAAGAYVQPHPSQQRLAVLPRYPVAPWAWASTAPDIELPASVAINEGTEWADMPRYNGVYVSGSGPGGVLALVRRTGSAGDVLSPMVVDRLTTHVSAARQRGLALLADTGAKAYISLALPVLQATGVILPGKLVRYTEGAAAQLGLVRGVRVDVVAGSYPQPTEVWQTIRLETQAS